MAFVGIRRRGVPLAQRLAQKIEDWSIARCPSGILDIVFTATICRRFLSPTGPQCYRHSFPVTGKDVILMDDVLYTGPTIRAPSMRL